MKRGTPRHPKMRHLCELLAVPLYSAVGILELLWHFTAEFSPRGDIGRHSDIAISNACGWRGKPDKLITALVQSGWINEDGEHRLVIHDWNQHADDATRKRLVRMNENFVDAADPTIQPSIYFVHAPSLNRVKIGFTEGRVQSRVDALQTGSAEKLIHLGSVGGTRYAEAQLHKRFASFRLEGEWFEVKGEFERFLVDTIQFGVRNSPKFPTQSDDGSLPEPCLASALPVPSPEPPVRAVLPAIKSALKPARAADLNGIAGNRFDEFWQRYPRQDDRDSAVRMYLSVVTADEEPLVFACLDRYAASDEVARRVVMASWKWLEQQHRNQWGGRWPMRAAPAAKLSVAEQAKLEHRQQIERNGSK